MDPVDRLLDLRGVEDKWDFVRLESRLPDLGIVRGVPGPSSACAVLLGPASASPGCGLVEMVLS